MFELKAFKKINAHIYTYKVNSVEINDELYTNDEYFK